MIIESFFAGPWGPLLIFFARLIDVSMATLRMMLSIRGVRWTAPLIGFFEALLWVLAVGTAIRHLDSPLHVVGYAGGFAAGSWVGLWIEGRRAFGVATIRIISTHAGVELADALRGRGYGVTEFQGHGRDGPVEVVFTVSPRRQVPDILREVDTWDPDAFVTLEQAQGIERGWLFQRRRK
jgi:uncharacterized protein YebE (UPF0316 family)